MRIYAHLPEDQRPAQIESLRRRIAEALREDLGEAGDVTTKAIFGEDAGTRARVVAKAEGIMAGAEVFQLVFEVLQGGARVELLQKDGHRVKPGEEVIRLEGPMRTLLSGERTALNFLQRLSGVATLTARYVEAAAGRVLVCDTRKTTPLWRDLEKYAVRCGGGVNHRSGLFDMVMIKDTHADGAGGLAAALERVEPLRPGLRIAAEARNLDEVKAALAAKVDLVMLDNMEEEMLARAAKLINGAIPTEVTGGVRPERLEELADLGIDRVSVGALTHSAPALDFSMRVVL